MQTIQGTAQDVFDVASWLDRANGRATDASPAPSVARPFTSVRTPADYVPRHRADVPVDSRR